MKKNLTIVVENASETVEPIKVQGMSKLWKTRAEIIKKYGNGIRIIVKDENDQPYMDFTATTLKTGKVWWKNAIEATRRRAKPAEVVDVTVEKIPTAKQKEKKGVIIAG